MHSVGSLPRPYVSKDAWGCQGAPPMCRGLRDLPSAGSGGPPMCRGGRSGGTQYARVRVNLQGWEEAVSRLWGSVSACFTKRSHRGLDTPFPSRGRVWGSSPPTEAGKPLHRGHTHRPVTQV